MTSTAALKAGTAANSIGEGNNAPGHQPLTAQLIADRITDGLSSLALAFTEMEQRIVADNGKRYPLDATLPDGVEDSGSIELVNRFGFQERSIVSCVTWKLETMVEAAATAVEDQKTKIRNAVRDMQRGRCDEQIVDRLVAYLDALEERQAIVVAAFNSAIDAHATILGEDFETKAIKAERLRTQQSKPGNAKLDALKARGLA